MNRGFIQEEMLHCTDVAVLERQRARMKWHQDQQQQSYFGGTEFGGGGGGGVFQGHEGHHQVQNFQGLVGTGGGDLMLGEVVSQSVKVVDPAGLKNRWAELGRLELPQPDMGFESCGLLNGTSSEFEMTAGAISRTSSCPPKAVVAAVTEPKGKVSAPVGKESSKKRKADKVQNTQVGVFHYQDLCSSFYHGDCKTMPPKKRYFNFSMLSLLFGTHLLSIDCGILHGV